MNKILKFILIVLAWFTFASGIVELFMWFTVGTGEETAVQLITKISMFLFALAVLIKTEQLKFLKKSK